MREKIYIIYFFVTFSHYFIKRKGFNRDYCLSPCKFDYVLFIWRDTSNLKLVYYCTILFFQKYLENVKMAVLSYPFEKHVFVFMQNCCVFDSFKKHLAI